MIKKKTSKLFPLLNIFELSPPPNNEEKKLQKKNIKSKYRGHNHPIYSPTSLITRLWTFFRLCNPQGASSRTQIFCMNPKSLLLRLFLAPSSVLSYLALSFPLLHTHFVWIESNHPKIQPIHNHHHCEHILPIHLSCPRVLRINIYIEHPPPFPQY